MLVKGVDKNVEEYNTFKVHIRKCIKNKSRPLELSEEKYKTLYKVWINLQNREIITTMIRN